MKSKIILFCIMVSMISCNENRIYEEHTDPSGELEWNREEMVSFDIEIIDTSIRYNVILALRFATGFAYSKCPITISEELPSGEIRNFSHEFITRDEKGYTGDGAGDIYDLEEIWRSSYKFIEPGIYHYEIGHKLPESKVHMVMEVGMIVDININM